MPFPFRFRLGLTKRRRFLWAVLQCRSGLPAQAGKSVPSSPTCSIPQNRYFCPLFFLTDDFPVRRSQPLPQSLPDAGKTAVRGPRGNEPGDERQSAQADGRWRLLGSPHLVIVQRSCSRSASLTLRELDAAACAVQTVLLAFLHAGVAGQQTGVADLLDHGGNSRRFPVGRGSGLIGRRVHFLESTG